MGLNLLGFGQRTQVDNSIPINLASGQGYVIPSGQYQITPGPYTFFQVFDPVTLMWRTLGTPSGSDPFTATSDGTNYRLFNATGTMVGASITNAGTGYTNGIYPPALQLGTAAAPSVTMSTGSGTVLAKPTLIVGGSINSTVTFTGGSNYTLPPILVVSPPPAGGVPATMYVSTLTSGAIAGVTVTNVGAGYTSAPTVTVVNAQGDTTGSGGAVTVNATLAGSGTVTAITIQGNVPMPSSLTNTVYGQNGVLPSSIYTGSSAGAGMTAVPTFTFSPASTTAATANMCFTVTTLTLAGATQNTNGNIPMVCSGAATVQSTNTNPAITTQIFMPRLGYAAGSTSNQTTTTILDGGLHIAAPVAGMAWLSTGTIPAATTAGTLTYGPTTDVSYIQPL